MSRTTAPANAAGISAEQSADPIFERIAAHADLYRQGIGWPANDPDGFDAHCDLTNEAMYEALEITPTTVPGMVAYLAFVESFETFRGVGLDDDDIKLICGKAREFVLAQASATPGARIDAALAEIKAALAELYPAHSVTGHASLRVSTGLITAGAYPEDGYEARGHFHLIEMGGNDAAS